MKRKYTKDSSLAYYVNQLENLDKRLYEPLVEITWSRDIKLRAGITMSNETTSFILSSFAANGTMSAQGKAWVSPESTTLPGVSVNGKKINTPLRPLARQVAYTSIELERSQDTQQPIDVQQINALNTIYQMENDAMVYIGDTDVDAVGLLNNPDVTTGNVATGVSGSTLWVNKTADEIVADVNALLTATWKASAYAVCPSKLLLPPAQFSYIASQKVSSAGNVSILKYIQDNSISLTVNGKPLDIQPTKWLAGAGTMSSDRMVAYTNDESRVRFPMVPIRRETAYYQGITFFAPYLYAFGEVEFVYLETVQYADEI